MAPTKTASKPPADDATDDQAVDYQARARALEAELAALRIKAAEAEGDKPPKETHVLVLANGDQVRTASPVATQHHVEGLGLVPVVNVFELSGEEE